VRGLEELIGRLDASGDLTDFGAWVGSRAADAHEVWSACPTGEWLLWLAATVGVDEQLVVGAGLSCVRDALEAGGAAVSSRQEVARAVQTVEAWTRGEASVRQCDDAGYLVYSTAIQAVGGQDEGWAAGIADAAVWVSSLVVRIPAGDPKGEQGGRLEYASSALMTGLRAAEALAHVEVPGALVTSAAWVDAFERGRRRCAELVRAAIPFASISPRLEAVLGHRPTRSSKRRG
jgi:hypothetical protein